MEDETGRLVAAAIDRLAGALEAATAAWIETKGARAGQPRSAKPIGTPVAFDSIDSNNDTTVDRSIESISIEPIDRKKVDYEKVLHSVRVISRFVRAKPGVFWKRDRALVWMAVVLVQVDRLPRQWLADAVDGVRQHGPTNAAAYFRRCLVSGLMDLDPQIETLEAAAALLRQLEALVEVPQEWIQPKPRQHRPEAAAPASEPASEGEIQQLLGTMDAKLRDKVDQVTRKLPDSDGLAKRAG